MLQLREATAMLECYGGGMAIYNRGMKYPRKIYNSLCNFMAPSQKENKNKNEQRRRKLILVEVEREREFQRLLAEGAKELIEEDVRQKRLRG